MSDPNSVITNIFAPFQEHINAEQDIREEIKKNVKEIEKTLREIVIILQIIHNEIDVEKIHAALINARAQLEIVQQGFNNLDRVVPAGQYYRYHDNWRYSMQKLCFLASLIVFLENGTLVDQTTVGEMLGVHSTKNLHLDLEDYLMGLLFLASELSRFAVNAVTFGDYQRPIQISQFVSQLNAGFRLMNLKNDSLRKRFDALKYDVKKIEEVVYDLSIRGLVPTAS